MSPTRKSYFFRFIARIFALAICLLLYFVYPESFDVLNGMQFFTKLSPLHILWAVWVFDMLLQILPLKNKLIALGSQKLFLHRYTPATGDTDKKALKKYITKSTFIAYIIFIVWWVVIGGIGSLYLTGIIGKKTLFMVTPLFYVFDLICVLFLCPFRFILRNRCCTSCRIFNWDHMMMFSPIVFIGGFYSLSLVVLSFVTFFVWEISVFLHPERFWHGSNDQLKCSNCTEKLCSHRCKKKVTSLF